MAIKLNPRFGALLENRYQKQVESMLRLILRVNETLEKDSTSESVTLLDLENQNLINLFDVIFDKLNCKLFDVALLYMHLSTYMMMRSMYQQMVVWGATLFEWYKKDKITPPAALFHCVALGHEGLKHYDEALNLYRDVILKYYEPDLSQRDLASIHYGLSRIYYFKGQIEEASIHCIKAMEIDEDNGDVRELVMAMAHYSELLWYVADYATGLAVINEALELSIQEENMMLASTLIGQKAKILAEIGQPDEVITTFEGAIQLLEFRNDEISLAQTMFLYGEYLHKHSRYEEAYHQINCALEIFERYQSPQEQVCRQQLLELQALRQSDD